MKSICGISLNGALIALALVALLVLPAAAQTKPTGKPQTATVGSVKHVSPQEMIIRKRTAQGYSVIGPLELKGVSSSQLVIGAAPGSPELTVSLKDKKVSVMDEAGNGLTLTSLNKGTFVIICQKKDQVVIYVIPMTKKEPSNAR